ncbi:hypothetical protein PA27867_2778 [Cryobacterium arcticum]|uniref:DUF3027 domain-containing protein n=1 Tax=Cryobacterium arcticum TaxID=670052 RepID=A0A1B1BM12_9MICO|nr:hypothetical protein PA27867_2778 [Cryobacterium arcticum]
MRDPFDPTPPPAQPVETPVEGALVDETPTDSTVPDATAADAPADDAVAADTDASDAPADDAAPAEDAPAGVDAVTEVDDDEVFEADEVLVGATDQARAALELITPADTIGEPIGYIVEGEHVLSLLFDCLMTGYPGWRWTVSLSRVDGESEPQVLETELMPGDDALLAPEWVPWSDRLADSKLAEELAAAALTDDDSDDDDSDDDSDDDDSDDDDDDDSDDDDDDSDDGDEADLHADDIADDGIDVDEALAASEQHEGESSQAEAQPDGGAPQPPAQAGVAQFSSENDR